MLAYHYTNERYLESILEIGLIPSSGHKENLPFVMLTKDKYEPGNGNRVYLEVELDENDPAFSPKSGAWRTAPKKGTLKVLYAAPTKHLQVQELAAEIE